MRRHDLNFVSLSPVAQGNSDDEFGGLTPVERYVRIVGILGQIHERVCGHKAKGGRDAQLGS